MTPYELPFYIDGTMRSSWKTCPRKFFYAYVMRKVTPHASIHLHAGKAFAKACEETRIAYYAEGKSWQEAVDIGQVHMVRAWAEAEEEVDPQASGKTLPNMLHLHEKYFEEYDRGNTNLRPVVRHEGKPAVEFSFAVPIPGTSHPVTGEPILYVGRLDMLASREPDSDVVWAVDEKTTAQLGPKWGTQWELRGQFIGYAWAVSQYGYKCAGAVVRGCKITSTGAIGFAEVPIAIKPHLMDRWLGELQQDCADIKAAWEANAWRYDFADGCSSYGGCPYQIACSAKQPEKWIEHNFVDNLWNPVTGEGTLDNAPRVPVKETTE